MSDDSAHDGTLDRVLERLETLEAENARLAAKVAELEGNGPPRAHLPPPYGNAGNSRATATGISRRRLLTRMAGAGAVGAGVLAVGDIFAPRAAQAAQGDPLILGNSNDAQSFETELTATTSGGEAALRGINPVRSGIIAPGNAGLIGDAGNARIGVIGLGSAGGSGTAATGVLGVAGNTSGVAVWNGFESVAPSVGGVVGDTNVAPYAVAGTSSVGAAIYGCSFGPAQNGAPPIAAVVGDTNSTSNPALMGRNSNGPQLRLVPSGVARPASGVSGELIQDKNNILWLCVGGTSWRKLGGLKTAGQLHVLSSPVRVYDSRTKDGPLANGQERTVSLTTGTNGTTPAVPAGAIASLFTLTIVNTGSSGFLAAFSNAVSYPGTSNIDWFLINSILATSVTSALDASGKIKVHCGGTKTDFVIDVTGYYE